MAEERREIQKSESEKHSVERASTRKVFTPRTDIVETADALFVMADMPGVDREKVDVSLEKNVLTIRGEVHFTQPEGQSLAYAEYGVGDFERSFVLSDEIDRGKIEASVKSGVLRVRLPKAGPAQARRITVHAG